MNIQKFMIQNFMIQNFMIQNFMIQNFMNVYFTPLPYIIYQHGNTHGNMAYAGIGLGLIHCQSIFWVSNTILSITVISYTIKNEYNYYHIFAYLLCAYLYSLSIIKTKYLFRLIR